MRHTARRNAVIWWMLVALVASVAALGASPTGAAESTLDYSFQGWFQKGREGSVIVPTPNGDISPGALPSSPNAADGTYLVSSSGGEAGSDGGDLAWTGFQWQMFAFSGQTVLGFELELHKSPDARGDAGTPQLRACNAVVPWSAADGANPWADRPIVDCSRAIGPDIDGDKMTFDLTPFAQKWVTNDGFGVVILPGDADDPEAVVSPFQYSIAGYDNPDPESRPVAVIETASVTTTTFAPPVTFAPPETFAPPATFDSGGGFPSGGFDPGPTGGGFVEQPTDSAPPDTQPTFVAPPGVALPQPISSSDPGVNLALFLLLPVLAGAIWTTGTALGPAGEPVPARTGGLSELLDARAAKTDR